MTAHLLALAALFALMLGLIYWAHFAEINAAIRRLFSALGPRPPEPDPLSPESHHAALYEKSARDADRHHNIKALFYAAIAIALGWIVMVKPDLPPPDGPAIVDTDRGVMIRTWHVDPGEGGALVMEWRMADSGRLVNRSVMCC